LNPFQKTFQKRPFSPALPLGKNPRHLELARQITFNFSGKLFN
jgi:hypothetical protein